MVLKIQTPAVHVLVKLPLSFWSFENVCGLSSLNSLQIPNLVKSKAPLEKVETWWRWHVSLNTGYIKRQFWNRWERRMVVTPSLLLVIPFFILGAGSCVSFRNPPRVQAVCLCVYLGECAYMQAFSRVHTKLDNCYICSLIQLGNTK